ncbi:peptidase M19 [Roseivirga sp. 4D4]|uniref:dipeptidase n=1 Tax=Roseivirga sp. 4D4 TaxID=1889784 RepID=UPI000853716C|nr:dipeptidase [Roseivirga sp. 4D4]OEK03107.1 peptidase M19 [Roseivirga sp. 4D4]
MKTRILLAIFGLSLINMACETTRKELSDDELMSKAKELVQQYIIVDGHVDLPYRMEQGGFMVQQKVLNVSVGASDGNFDFPRAKEGGLDAPFMSIYIPAQYQQVPGYAKKFADSLINMTKQLADTYPDEFAIAYSPDDVEQHFKAGKISLPMGMENGAPLEGDIALVEYFQKAGIRYVTLTHGRDNKICDSSYDTTRTHGGLSEYGRQVISEMNRVGIMVDISHVSDDTFWQVMELSKAPAIASHSSVRHFTPGFERNMNDEMIKKLGENDGVIMINFGSSFLDGEYRARRAAYDEHVINWLADNELTRDDPKAKTYIEEYTKNNDPWSNVQKVADHIDRVVELTGGTDNVGFGSDFDGVGDSLPTGLKDVSTYPNLIYELLKRGYSDEDIAKMCYKNVFRVWREVEEIASRS